MYSNEIEKMLKENNNMISQEEYLKGFNPNISTQIKYIKYDSINNSFLVITNDNYFFSFCVKPRKNSVAKVKKCK